MKPTGPRAFTGGFLAGLLAAVVLLLVAASLGGDLDIFDATPDTTVEALDVIEEDYWRDPDLQKLNDESVRAIVRSLRKRFDDRFSHYFDPEEFEQFETATSGEFSGVGLTVNEVKRGLRVARVFADTPADRAGIGVGEVITGVDGKSIANRPADVATARIKGPPGTEVTLTVLDPQADASREVNLERAKVRIPAVEGEVRRVGDSQLGVVRMATFSEGAHGELRDEVERLYRRGAEGLVLDLRGNGGGLLEEAVLSASVFIEDGVIVRTRGRTQPRRVFRASGDALDPRPLVVLVNGDTASAAEILAAALEDEGLATLVGERTFGKGTFQQVIELEGGGALDLTVGEFVTADGKSLAGSGLKPSVRVKRAGPGSKAALDRALAALGKKLAADG